MVTRRFGKEQLQAFQESRGLAVRGGRRHRFIHIWAVVVEGRLFARSWSVKPNGWYRAFLGDPSGAIQTGGRTIQVHAVHPRSRRLLGLIDRAYALKYDTPASLKYVRDLCRPRSKRTTTEFVPAQTVLGARPTRGR